MPLITADFENFITERVESGRYSSVNDVLEAAKSALLEREADGDLDVEYVRRAVQEGIDSGMYQGDIFADLRKKYGLS